MTKESKFVYGMVAASLVLVSGFFVLWKISSKAVESGQQKSGLMDDRFVEGDIELIDANGESRGFQQLRGKVSLVSHVFTRCPGQCAGICVALDELREEFGDVGPLQLVSVSLDPAHDRPENLKKFAETHNLVRPNWWFVTGDPEELNKYMLKVFALSAKPKPPEQRANEFDLFDHQAIVVLVDHELKMVGWYYPFESKSMEQLKKQLRATLATAEKAA